MTQLSDLFFVEAVCSVVSLQCQSPNHSELTVTPREAAELMRHDTSVVVLDVRTSQEFSGPTGHLAGALLIPIQELEQRIVELDRYKSRAILAYCRTGQRSGQAQRLLNSRWFRTLNMDGGILKWDIEKLPIVMENQP